jgi:hypothetical protein
MTERRDGRGGGLARSAFDRLQDHIQALDRAIFGEPEPDDDDGEASAA